MDIKVSKKMLRFGKQENNEKSVNGEGHPLSSHEDKMKVETSAFPPFASLPTLSRNVSLISSYSK